MNDVKWSCVFDHMTEEDISKQKSLFELVPGPHKFTVTIENNPGDPRELINLLNAIINLSKKYP